VVSERDFICILQVKEDRVAEDSVGTCLLEVAVRRQSFGDCEKMKPSTQDCWSDSSRSVEGTDRHSKMATEGHRKKSKAEKLAEWDEEETRKLYELKADIEKMELRMRQDRRRRRLRELPMKKAKVKWPVKQLMVIRQCRLLKRWLRYAENLRATEKDMICYCWPETGKSLDGDDDDDDWDKLESVDGFKYCRLGRKEEIPVCQEDNKLGSVEDLKDCREGSQGNSNFQLGRGTELGSVEDLKDCREESQETLHCQLGDERRSSEGLEDCQEGSGSILSCLEGRDEKLRLSESLLDSRESSSQQRLLMKMGSVDLIICQGSSSGSIPYGQMGRDDLRSQTQPGELTEHISSQEDQRMKLTGEEEHQDDILMIGGIEIFLPFAQGEAENSVAHTATAEQSQLEMTIEEEELEQVSETAQVDEEKNECSEEQLNDFSQQAERAVALRLTATKEKEEDEHSKEWLDIFSIVAGKTATGEFVAEGEENEHFEECLNEFSQEAERAAALKLTAEEAEREEEHSEEWLSIFSHEVENNATWEVAEAEEGDTDNICLVELWEQIEALEDRVKVQGMHIQQVRLETDEEDGMGDRDDLSNGQNLLQLRRLQTLNQPQEQLDREIEDIRRLMLKSAETTSEEKLGREKAAAAQRKQQQQNGAHEKLQRLVWDPGGFQQLQGKLMSRSS
jgi:hypothetical protein